MLCLIEMNKISWSHHTVGQMVLHSYRTIWRNGPFVICSLLSINLCGCWDVSTCRRDCRIGCCCAPAERCGAASALRRERDSSPKKRLHNHSQNNLNTPGYIARTWAYYNNIRGAPFPRINVTEWVKCTKQSPNQTPMHPERCHNCASQWHLDTMHKTRANIVVGGELKEELIAHITR